MCTKVKQGLLNWYSLGAPARFVFLFTFTLARISWKDDGLRQNRVERVAVLMTNRGAERFMLSP